jgi:hypothetical protein
MTSVLLEDWDGTNWVNYWRYTYTYDSNGNMTSKLYEYWFGTDWVLLDNYLSFSDSLGNSYSLDGADIKIFYKTITSVEENETIMNYSLSQNYPNPFNPSTTIKYSIPTNVKSEIHQKDGGQALNVKLVVYDILGREVVSLVNEVQKQGNYEVNFNANNLTSGIYFYRLQSGNFSESKKMILIK